MQILILVLLAIAIVVGGPIATIMSLNVLFGLNIEITLANWLAAFWLTAVIGGGVLKYRKK